VFRTFLGYNKKSIATEDTHTEVCRCRLCCTGGIPSGLGGYVVSLYFYLLDI